MIYTRESSEEREATDGSECEDNLFSSSNPLLVDFLSDSLLNTPEVSPWASPRHRPSAHAEASLGNDCHGLAAGHSNTNGATLKGKLHEEGETMTTSAVDPSGSPTTDKLVAVMERVILCSDMGLLMPLTTLGITLPRLP